MSRATELVCVVDDDQSMRRGLRRLLKSAGYAAETFSSAEDYLARKAQQPSAQDTHHRAGVAIDGEASSRTSRN